MLGSTVQLYTTGRCRMNCTHCGSRKLSLSDMTLNTFKVVVRALGRLKVKRMELFANDPLLHPEIEEQVDILNGSGLDYAVLTVGASPGAPDVKERFLRVMRKIDRERGGFVFSVDYSEETAKKILIEAGTDENTSYAFKANTFWELAPLLRQKGVPVRTNTVISKYNVREVVDIVRRIAQMGFATSFCFVQTRQPKFDELSNQGLTLELEGKFRKYLHSSRILAPWEVDEIVKETKKITENELEDKKDPSGEVIERSPFNTFRGNDRSEVEIPSQEIVQLRKELLRLKKSMRGRVLPVENFIRRIGEPGVGCIEFLKRREFPSLKIGPKGEIIFCCDLHDPYSGYSIVEMDEFEKRQAFIKMCIINPYIWICTFFNPCDFSINWIRYNTIAAKI